MIFNVQAVMAYLLYYYLGCALCLVSTIKIPVYTVYIIFGTQSVNVHVVMSIQ